MLRGNCSSGACRCRLLKLSRRGTTTAVCGDFGILPLGGHVGVVGGGEAGKVKEAGCLVFLPLTTLLVVIDGVRTITHAAGGVTTRIVRTMSTGAKRTMPRIRTPRMTPLPRRSAGAIACGKGMISGSALSGPVFRMIRRVPRFPSKNVSTLVRCLDGGVGCPRTTVGGNARKQTAIRFMIRGSNDVAGMGVLHNVSPRLGGRTMHMVDTVPG